MNLNVKKREVFGKALASYRKKWQIPGIVYSKHMKESIPVFFEKIPFLKIFEQSWYSSPITLKGDWVKEMVLVSDINVDSVSDRLLHVDFHAVKADETTEAEVPVRLIWESPIEKQSLWKVELVKDSVLVEALPKNLPNNIELDISKIESLNDVVFVKDLKFSDDVEIKDDLELPILTIVEIKEEKEEEITESEVPSEDWQDSEEVSENN